MSRRIEFMFKELGQMMSMFKHLPRLKEEMEKLQARLGQITAEGDAGAGMVRVRVNGHMEVQSCTLSDEAFKSNDKELVEDLIAAAVNQALQRVRQQVAEETSKMAMGMGIPAGLNLPGLG
jgi:DNA-binding YbaB/EbfC family protein